MQERFFLHSIFPLRVPEADSAGEKAPSRRLLAFGGALMLAEMDFESGAASRAHSHPEEQLTYCLSGEFEAEVDMDKRRLVPGDSFYAGPGQSHGVACIAAGKLLHVFTPQRQDYK